MTQTKMSERELAVCQAILEHKGITKIRSLDLSDILKIDVKRAGMLLSRLDWRMERLKRHHTVWHKEGSHKIFENQPRKILVKRAAMLGFVLE